MKTKAIVIETNGKTATVEAERASACEGCHKKNGEQGCSVCSLVGGERKFRATADNRLGAKVGDAVYVESATSRVLFYAALVFICPLVLAFLGFCVARIFTAETPFLLLGAGSGFVLAFVGLHIYSGVLRKKQPDAVITEIVHEANENI